MSFKIVKVESIRREGLLIESIRHEWLKIVSCTKVIRDEGFDDSFTRKAFVTNGYTMKSIRHEWIDHSSVHDECFMIQ